MNKTSERIATFINQRRVFSSSDLQKHFGVTKEQAAGYLAQLSRKGCIAKNLPAKDVNGSSRWYVPRAVPATPAVPDLTTAQFVALATQLGSKVIEEVLEHVRTIEAARDKLNKVGTA